METRFTLNLRVPFFIGRSTDTVSMSILYADAEPSASSPYIAPPTLSLSAVRVNFTRYSDICGQASDRCLEAAWGVLQNYERANEEGVTCLPPERVDFIAGLYDTCFRKY